MKHRIRQSLMGLVLGAITGLGLAMMLSAPLILSRALRLDWPHALRQLGDLKLRELPFEIWQAVPVPMAVAMAFGAVIGGLCAAFAPSGKAWWT